MADTAAAERAKHTPGPWVADDHAIPRSHLGEDADRYIRSEHRHWSVCASFETHGCTSPGMDISAGEAAANARLIAAAPAMYEALQALLSLPGVSGRLAAIDLGIGEVKSDNAWVMARAALAAAEGRS